MSKYPDDDEVTEVFQPLDYPLGDVSHHTDVPFTHADLRIGDKLGWYMGDLFLNSRTDPPRLQWQKVARALRIHGLQIVNRQPK